MDSMVARPRQTGASGPADLVPLVVLAELAFAVAFGVLLDTLVVRSLLVPALILDVGPVSWWPGRLFPAAGHASAIRADGTSLAS